MCCRALDVNMHCVEAIVYQILHILCKEGVYPEVGLTFIYFFFSVVFHLYQGGYMCP